MNLKCSLFTLLFIPSVGICQSAITTSGGEGNGAGGSFAFSIGQVCNSSAVGNGGYIQEGVQQTYEISAVEVEESMATMQLSIFPNPTSGKLIIQQNACSEELSISIFDFSGSLIQSFQSTSATISVDAGNWAVGIYCIEITSANLPKSRYKVVKG